MIPGHHSYVCGSVMPLLKLHARRLWRVAGRIVSLEQRDGGGVVKVLDKFGEVGETESAMMGFLRECADVNVRRPSSFSDVFHQRYHAPAVKRSVNNLFARHFVGAWEAAPNPGRHSGVWYKYDLNRAYYWAVTEGLPEPASFRWCLDTRKPGLFLVELPARFPFLPYPLSQTRRVIVSNEEIRTYQLTHLDVRSGVTWTREQKLGPILAGIDGLSCSKRIGQTYWGRWASRAAIDCATVRDGADVKTWPLNNNLQNFVWAHLILSRVKQAVYRACPRPAHVFCDSIITQEELPVSTSPGGWKLVHCYRDGVRIDAPGRYGPLVGPLDAHAGTRTA
jgi:hypothetical protein